MTLSDQRIDSRFSKMAETQSKETQEALIRDLDEQYKILKRQILQYQSVTLGLFPKYGSVSEPTKEAHIRDSIYCAAAAWALSQAYRRKDDDHGRTHELAQVAVKCMRGILFCWLRQAEKVERFKENQSPAHALHCVFDALTGDPIYRDDEYEHLQIDVIGLYLIFLVQMIKSGLQIIFTTDEVNFVQNLVFYVERAYRTPDYGMWERGSKYNNGNTEMHASSIGFAKAALESINGINLFGDQGASWSVIFVDIDAHNRNRTIFESILPRESNSKSFLCCSSVGFARAALETINGENLFGDQGASWSVIFVDIDAHNRNRTIFESILPRESNSKNTDASLLLTVGWPAFAIHEEPIRSRTIDKVIRKLKGKCGIKRFFRDGYKTVIEDKNRKYYKPAEIKNFDGIECEWPMFYVFLLFDCIFRGDNEGITKYTELLDPLMTRTNDGLLIPQYFFVQPGEAERIPSDAGTTDGIFMWGQAVYFISQLLGLLNISELDPIRRHLPASERPKANSRYSSFQVTPPDLVIQVVLIAESSRLQQLLATYGIPTQTPHQVEPIQIWSPKELSKAYEYLGFNKKLDLTGRPKRPFGVLSTSKIYRACGATVLCYPLLFELSDFYMAQDVSVVVDDLKTDLAFLCKGWKLAGRPTFCMLLRENNIRGPNFSEFIDLLAQLKRGEIDGVRVRVGKLQSMISSACIEHLDFLHHLPDAEIFHPFEESIGRRHSFKSLTEVPPIPEISDKTSFDEQELKHKATWDLINMLRHTENLMAQSQILKLLFQREGPNYHVEGVPVNKKLEHLITKAGIHKEWYVVRLCSALLGKMVDSLAPSITSILVRGKHVTVGVFGHEEEVLDKPVSPNEIKNILYAKCMPYDICQAVLQQELILAIGKLIATDTEKFDGILKIRIGWFVRAMEMELEQEEEIVKNINSLSPYHIKQLLQSILSKHPEEDEYPYRSPVQRRGTDGTYHREYDYGQTPCRSPLQRRQIDGALSRVPKDFYERVWEILERTPGGIKVAGYLLPQQPTLSDMTMYELNFSLLVEQMLSLIVDPAYRQMMVETFMVVSTILRRNPEFTFSQPVQMDKTIQDAFDEFQKDLNKQDGLEKQDDMRMFLNTQPFVKHGTTSYIAKAVVKNLLDGDFNKMAIEEMCCIS